MLDKFQVSSRNIHSVELYITLTEGEAQRLSNGLNRLITGTIVLQAGDKLFYLDLATEISKHIHVRENRA